MRFYNRGTIIAGIVVFVVLVTLPLWYGLGKRSAPPEPSLDTPAIAALMEKRCVEETAYMRANHMRLLHAWRDSVVREGQRLYTTRDGKAVQASLTGTCLKCHSNQEQFCSRCHDYAGAKPNCMNCHINPAEVP